MFRQLFPVAVLGLTAILGTSAYSSLRASAAPSNSAVEAVASSPSTVNLASPSATTYQIDPSSSTATFAVDEVLLGRPNHVTGTTNQVTGQISLDPSDPTTAGVSAIQIQANALATDDTQRNRAISNFILDTRQYPSITFAPTSISGLPAQVTVGQTYPVQIAGQLTIKDVSRPVIFDATVTVTSPTQINGTAFATVNRSDWNLMIPQVPTVAGVAEQVDLSLSFSAASA